MTTIRTLRGVTLFELLVSLALISILTAMAMPAMSSLIESSRSKVVRQQLQSFLSEVRSVALHKSQIVTVCRLDEDDRCESELSFPLTAFVDANRNQQLESQTEVLRRLDFEMPDNLSMAWNRHGYLRYWPSGGTGALTGSLTFCHANSTRHDFRIVIARTGRTRVDFDETGC